VRTPTILRRVRLAVVAVLAVSAVTGATVTLGSTAAVAASPRMSVDIAATTTTVDSGGTLVYRVTYQCSNVTSEPCTAPVLTLPTPVGTSASGETTTAAGPGVVRGNGDITSSTGTPLEVRMRDLVPGTSGEFTVAWTIPNGVTLPGTAFPATVDVAYTDPNAPGVPSTTSATTPVPVVARAVSALTGSKTMVSPAGADQVQPDQDTTYSVYACNPSLSGLGGLDYRGLVLVDQLPDGTDFVSATGGGTYDPSAQTVTWTVPDTTANNDCSSPASRYEVTVRYPADTFVPAPADPQATNAFKNTLRVTATGLDGAPLQATAAVDHSFIGPPLTPGGGGNIGVGVSKTVNGPRIESSDTTTTYWWGLKAGWQFFDDPTRDATRASVLVDRMPCVTDDGVSSPAISGDDPLDDAFPGTMGVPSDQCHTPGFSTDRVRFTTEGNAAQVEQVEVATWNGSTSAIRTWTRSASTAAAPFSLYIHGSAAAAGDETLDLPADEIVTDLRVVSSDLRNQRDSWVDVFGHNTAAYATSGFNALSNSYRLGLGAAVAPAGTEPAAGVGSYWARSAQKTTYVPMVDPQVTKAATTSSSDLRLGDTVTWKVAVANGPASTVPMHPMLVDVLPDGLTLDPESISWSGLGALSEPKLTRGTVEIGGVERTKLTWTWPTDETIDWGGNGLTPTVTFDTTVNLRAQAGSHTGDDSQLAIAVDPTFATVADGTNQPRDRFDVDGDGDTSEVVGQATAGWSVLPTSGASVEKLVKGAGDAEWTKSGLTGATFDGSDSSVDYRLAVANTQNAPLRDLVVYDVLPHVGDTAISKALAGVERGSAWSVAFEKMLTIPAGAEVQYSTSETPCRPELFGAPAGAQEPDGCDDDWSTTPPADASEVKALRIHFDTLAAGSTANVEFRTNAPVLQSERDIAYSDPTATANNNVAWQTERVNADSTVDTLPPAEAPLVTVRRAAGSIGDRVWFDTNDNGLQDEGESGVAGIVLELRDANGKAVLDGSGEPIRTETDADGDYRFIVPLGTWSVAVVDLPARYDLTVPRAGNDDAADSDAAAVGVATHTVTVTDPVLNGAGANRNDDLDVGLVGNGVVTITKDDGQTTVAPGGETTYAIGVSNDTENPVRNVIVSDTLPEELQFVSADNGGEYDDSTRTVRWEIGTVAPGSSTTVQVTAKVGDSLDAGSRITNTARLEGACTADCSASDTDVVETPGQDGGTTLPPTGTPITDPSDPSDPSDQAGQSDPTGSQGDAAAQGDARERADRAGGPGVLAFTGASGLAALGSVTLLLILAGAWLLVIRRRTGGSGQR